MADQNKQQFYTVRGYEMINRQEDPLTPSLEDYLEMVFRLCSKDGYTRVGKLSAKLHVKPSSVSKMILKLSDLQYIQYERYEIITLTEKGRIRGSFLLHRHNTIEAFLKLIGVQDTLEETELIEHSINPETLARINTLLEFFQTDLSCQKKYLEFQACKEL